MDYVTNVAEKFPGRNRNDGRFYVIDFTVEEIKTLDVTERLDNQDTSKARYPLRFPIKKSNFKLNTLAEEIELLQGLLQSYNNIHSLYSSSKTEPRKMGFYFEIKDPAFHKENNKPFLSEKVLEVLGKYNYKDKTDMCVVQTFDVAELRRIREELKSNLMLSQLLDINQASDGYNWTSRAGLEKIKEYADGVGPNINQLINYNVADKSVKPSEFHKNANELGLFIHPWTFRIDNLPPYAKSYDELMKIFITDLKVGGIITDFPDLTLEYIQKSKEINGASLNKISITLVLNGLILAIFNSMKIF